MRIYQRQPVKHPANPLIVADRPWEGSLVQLFTAVDYSAETQRWQMWYEGHPGPVLLCYATSNDGVCWQKPALGIEPFQGSTDNNIILQTYYWDAHQAAVVRAPNEIHPARRYKLYYWMGPEWYKPENPAHAAIGNRIQLYRSNGWYVAFSPDGIHFTAQTAAPALASGPLPDMPELPAGTTVSLGDYNTVFWNEQTGRYRSYHKLDIKRPGWDMSRRCLGMAESDDGLHFDPSVPVLEPDEEDDVWVRGQGGIRAEFYGLHVWPQSGFYLGLLWMFVVTKTGQPPYGRGWDDGPIAPHLIYSADGVHWQRLPVREPFIPLGPAGSFEQGSIFSGDRPTIFGDEVRFYYHGVSYTHGAIDKKVSPSHLTGIGLATLPRDRYVAWQGGAEPGMLRTVPLRFDGRELHLNVDASRGATKVALLGPDGSPLPGHGLDDCDPISADSLDHIVRWRGSGDLSALQGQPVRVQFWLRHSALYTWQFT